MLCFEEPLLSMDTYSVMRLPLDSEYFGFPCARAVLNGQIDETDLAAILKAISGYRFTTFININNSVPNNQLIQRQGTFLQTDINILLKRSVALGNPVLRDDVRVQNNYAADEALLLIADQAFLHSRFYNDPVMSKTKSAGFYRRWLSLSFDREDKYIITAGAPSPEGFLLFRCTSDTLVIELIGVLPGSRGKGTGSAMIEFLNGFALDNGFSFLQTGTQLENINALRFYQKSKFSIISANGIYHYWQ